MYTVAVTPFFFILFLIKTNFANYFSIFIIPFLVHLSTNLSYTQLSTLQKYILIIFSLLFSLSFLRNINLRSPLMFKKKTFLKIISFCVFRFKGIVFVVVLFLYMGIHFSFYSFIPLLGN